MASDDRGAGWWKWAGQISLVARSLLLSFVLGLAWSLSLPIAICFGEEGLKSTTMAALLCWVAGVNVMWLRSWFREDDQAFVRVAGSLILRASLPLAGGVWLVQTMDWAEKGGLAFYLIVFYQVMLATETTLDVARVEASAEEKKAAKKDRQDPPAS